MAFEAVIFDMDGVLVDSEPLHFASTNAVLAARGAAIAAAEYDALTGMGEAEFFALLVERLGLTERPDVLVRERIARSLELLASEPLPPRDGAAECLIALRAEGLRLALASSATRAQVDLVLARTGLRRLFEATVAIEDVRRGKPAPDLFLEAARRLDVPAGACLVVEDAALGVAAARAAGMRAVALVPAGRDAAGQVRAGAARRIAGLRELDLGLLASLGD